MTDVRILQMFLVIGVIVLFTSVSYSMFITYLILKKFSDFGDSSCKIDDYAPKGLGYTRMVDDVPPNEKYFLFEMYAVDPYSTKQHSIPEVLLKNDEKSKKGNLK